jgi:CubicO group peptidase (beta-lactamase class C family)
VDLFSIGCALKSKAMCNGIFASNLTRREIEQADAGFNPLFRIMSARVDGASRSVTGSILGRFSRKAVLVDGIGAVLVDGASEDEIRSWRPPIPAPPPADPGSTPWPAAGLREQGRVLGLPAASPLRSRRHAQRLPVHGLDGHLHRVVVPLRHGVWQGERVLPEGWMRYATTPAPAAPMGEYGACYWLNHGARDDPSNRFFPRLPPDAFFALGYQGQMIAMLPSRGMVVVRLGMTHVAGWGLEDFLAEVVSATGG